MKIGAIWLMFSLCYLVIIRLVDGFYFYKRPVHFVENLEFIT